MHSDSRRRFRLNIPVLLLTFLLCSSFFLGRQLRILFHPFLQSEDGNHQYSFLPQERVSRKEREKTYDRILRDGEPAVIITRKKRNTNFGSTATGTTNLNLDAVNQTMNATDRPFNRRNWSRNNNNRTLTVMQDDFFARFSKRSIVSSQTVERPSHIQRQQQDDPPSVIPEFPWESTAIESRKCNTPNRKIPDLCCPGSYSAGGRLLFRPDVCNHTQAYDNVKTYALQYLQAQYPPNEHGHCDVCRIIDHLLDSNLTLSFVGDSVTRQAGAGLECELHRRGYQVETNRIRWSKRLGCSWRHCIGEKVQFTISKPESTKTAVIYHFGVYRPDPTNVDLKQEILPYSDIVIFDHGLHWKPYEQEKFSQAMKTYLRGFQNSNLTMLAWRETSAQHMDSPGGHYGWKKASKECVPIKAGEEKGYRMPIMQQAAHGAGLKWKNTLDKDFSNQHLESNELIFLPFRDYTVPLHYLHPNECTHYCYTPYLWLSLWKSVRIAMDRAILKRDRVTT
jgi:hypothetical protein